MSKLKTYRLSRGMSQEQLAVEAGTKKPSLTLAYKISKILKASIEDIFLPS